MQNLHMGMRARKLFALLLTFFTATVAQFKLKPFKVGIAVMCAISTFTRPRSIRRWHLHPLYMFGVHMMHNYLMTHRQNWIDPEYVRLWSTAFPNIPLFYKCTAARSYPESLVGADALKRMPRKLWKTTRACFIGLAIALSPAILFQLCKGRFQEALKFLPKIAVSSFALGLLPTALFALPALYHNYVGKNKVMHPALYACLSALVSTAVFRIEKGARLNVLQSYTEKVVLIALLRKFVFLECENNFDNKSVEDEDNNKSKPKNNLCIKEYFTSICIGAVAVMNN